MTEEIQTTPKARRPRKKAPIQLVVFKEDGSLDFPATQPPQDLTTVRRVLDWLGEGHAGPGTFTLMRFLRDAVVVATPKTEYSVTTEE